MTDVEREREQVMAQALVFRNISVFDSADGAIVPGQSVVVSDSQILWVGPLAAEPSIAGADLIDGTGRTMVPGLMNCHVHLISDGTETARSGKSMPDDPVEAAVQGVNNLRATLATGVTSVRDCGAFNEIAIKLGRLVARGEITGPRVQAAGRAITMTGGHGRFIGREADGPWGVVEAVRTELRSGADFIKIMATGGTLTLGSSPDHIAFHEEELAAAAREAHNLGKRITTHSIGGLGIKNAIRAGIDSIEHACYMDEESVAMAVNAGTILVPTLNSAKGIIESRDAIPVWMYDKVMHLRDAARASFAMSVDAGAQIACGTDAGTPGNPHTEVPAELELMVEFGMTPSQALRSATSVAARNFGEEESLGSIEAGKLADLLVVEGDPTVSISDIRKVVFVVKGGDLVVDGRRDPVNR